MNYNPIDKFPSNFVIILLVFLIAISFNLFAAIIYFISLQLDWGIDEKLIQSFSQVIILFGMTLLLSRIIPLKFRQIFRFEENIRFKYVLIGILGLISLNMFNTGFVSLQEQLMPDMFLSKYFQIKEYMNNLYKAMLIGSDGLDFLVAIIIGAIIPAFSEEFLFRGFGQRSLEENNSPLYSILAISIIFGFIHFNIINLIPLMLIGFFLGYLAYYSKNLLVPIIIHFLNNVFSILIMYLENPDETSQLDNIPFPYSLILAIVGLFGVFALIKLMSQFENSRT